MGSPPRNFAIPPYPSGPNPIYPSIQNLGDNPYNPNYQIPPSTPHPVFGYSMPIRNCDPDGGAPPPPMGFVFQPHLLSYAPEPVSPEAPEQTQIGEPCNIPGYQWIGASSSNCSMPGAILVGTDTDGSPIYAGRAYHEGDMIPAKVIPSKCVAYVAYGGEEHAKDQFEVLTQQVLVWQWAASGDVPHNAVEVGRTADGEMLYYGRVHRDGAVTPGKIQRTHGCCYYPFDGEEKSSTDYEVLCYKA